MARSIEMQNPEVRKLWWITMVVQLTMGFTNGLYLYTYGPYFYEKFGGSIDPSTAMLLTTILLGLRQGLVALLELPTGALADTIGRAYVVILSWITRVVFFLCLSFIWICKSPTSAFGWGVVASIAFAMNYTFFNGAFSAWCMDVLREKAPTVQFSWLASRAYSYMSFATMLGGVAAVALYAVHCAYLGFIIAAFLSFCVMGYSMFSMKEVKSLQFINANKVQFFAITKRMGEIIGKGAQICTKSRVLFWVVMTFGSYMFLLNIVDYLWPVYFESMFGGKENYVRNWILIVLVSELLGFFGSRILVILNKKWSQNARAHFTGYRRIFTVVTVIPALMIIAFGLQVANILKISYFFPLAIIVMCMSYGFVKPCYDILVNAYLPPEESQHRATVISAGSMLRSVLILLLAVPSGGSSGEKSPIYWAIPAILLLISSITAHVSMKRAANRKLAEATTSDTQGATA